ncbi:hypothetical protein PBI_MIMI_276 [Arthrobacter phage Mimi]|nr:hypothetical protein PBI_MIMI_70 [Arthrobacter phage Mimi]
MADYSKHYEVERLEDNAARINNLRSKARQGNLDVDAGEMKKLIEEANIPFHLSQCRKAKKMIRNDSPVLMETDFDGELDVFLTLTKTKALLLLMEELNDILDKKITQVERSVKPMRLIRKKEAFEARVAELRANRENGINTLNAGF